MSLSENGQGIYFHLRDGAGEIGSETRDGTDCARRRSCVSLRASPKAVEEFGRAGRAEGLERSRLIERREPDGHVPVELHQDPACPNRNDRAEVAIDPRADKELGHRPYLLLEQETKDAPAGLLRPPQHAAGRGYDRVDGCYPDSDQPSLGFVNMPSTRHFSTIGNPIASATAMASSMVLARRSTGPAIP